eukprot:14681785-Heterocapsa_arctica.AAC.1
MRPPAPPLTEIGMTTPLGRPKRAIHCRGVLAEPRRCTTGERAERPEKRAQGREKLGVRDG